MTAYGTEQTVRCHQPMSAPNKYELIINLKTAKALGLNVPHTLLGRGDRIGSVLLHRAMSAFGTKRTLCDRVPMSAFGGKADIGRRWVNVRF